MRSRFELRLSAEAESDPRALLVSSLLHWGPEARDAYAESLGSAFAELTLFPELGRPRDDLYPGCRALRVRQHVIFYEVGDAIVSVARILHSRMDPSGRVGG